MIIPDHFQDYLTFYHEVRTPLHPFFAPENNQRPDDRLLVVSSPSRMGNHLLMSMLDSHPELPRVPGEDGHHIFTFTQTNYDLHRYFQGLRGESPSEFLMDLASNGGGSKWRKFDRCFRENSTEGVKVSGVGVGQHSATVDFEGVVFPIDFESYAKSLAGSEDDLRKATSYADVLHRYLDASARLDPSPGKSERFDRYFVHGGMRTQLKWLCETHQQARILVSLRSFPSYAISQIKSRHGDIEPTSEMIQTAWEHWFHKVIDALYLAMHFPDQVGIVTFEALVESPEESQRALCRFLGIDWAPQLKTATILGNPVKGNSWSSRNKAASGGFYKPSSLLPADQVPEGAALIWEQVLACSVMAKLNEDSQVSANL